MDERFFQAVGLIAILLYLLPAAMRLTAAQRQMSLMAATGVVVVGIIVALAFWITG